MTDARQRKQARFRFYYAGFALILVCAGFALAGCGKKPSSVDPPPEVTNDTFPRAYPDPATDPKP